MERRHYDTKRGKKLQVVPALTFRLPEASVTKAAMSSSLKIGFLGAGKMALALGKGFVQAGLASAESVLASDPVEGARTGFAKDIGAKVTTSNQDILKFAEVLILAVKPDQVAPVLAEVRSQFTEKH